MRDREWMALDDEALERLLVERWLYRGAMLAVMLAAAIGTTYVGIRGVTTLSDQLTVGVLVVLAVAAGAIAFVMRLGDVRMYRELRRRRSRDRG
ncbi:MAG: hypothetical protein HY002_17225 [Candidatus Rokubacteria bacterium]|nr:hypothetical protein [Candidatus Rokubacteria bacterium]